MTVSRCFPNEEEVRLKKIGTNLRPLFQMLEMLTECGVCQGKREADYGGLPKARGSNERRAIAAGGLTPPRASMPYGVGQVNDDKLRGRAPNAVGAG